MRLAVAALLTAAVVPSAAAQVDLVLEGGTVQGALSYDGSTIVAMHDDIVTITFTVEYALGMSFPDGDEFNTVASVPVPESSIFRKQSMSSDSPDVPCSTAGCTGVIFTGQTVTFTTTFHAENPGSTTFTANTDLNLRTESDRTNNTWEVAVEVVETASVSDISVRIADVIDAETYDSGARQGTIALDKPVTVCAWIKNGGPDDADDVVVVGTASSSAISGFSVAQADFFNFARVVPQPATGTCVTDGAGGFTCEGISIAAGDSVKLNIHGFGFEPLLGTMGIQAARPSAEDPNTTNNLDFVTLDVIDNGARGFAVIPVNALTIVGQPIDFFVFDCPLNDDGAADFGPDGIPATDDDDCVPVPFAEWLLSGDIGSIAPIAGSTTRLTPALPIGFDSAGGVILAQYDQKSGEAIVTVAAPAAIHGRMVFPESNFDRGVDGLAVLLLDQDGNFIRQEITHSRDLDGDGFIDPSTEQGLFWFEDLLPGTYRLRLVLTPPWMPVDVTEMEVSLEPANIEVPIFEVTPTGEDMGDFNLDFGDLPSPYPDATAECPIAGGGRPCYQTLAKDNGAAHGIRDDLLLGYLIDPDADGAPDNNARGDDNNNLDDEDSAVYFDWPGEGGTARVGIQVFNATPKSAYLMMWVDMNDNGQLGDTVQEYAITGEPIPPLVGAVFVEAAFPVPPLPLDYDPFVRIRLTTDPSATFLGRPYGLYLDGEVEDSFVSGWGSGNADFGDAPDEPDESRPGVPAGYPTRLADDGARHAFVSTVRLGDRIDDEEEGQPTIDADGDDRDSGFNSDEDGVLFGPGFVVVASDPSVLTRNARTYRYGISRGATATLTPLASTDGKLDAWIDFNRDGDWDDDGEQVYDSVPVEGAPDYTVLNLTVPETAAPGVTFVRFRFSIEGDLEPSGIAPNGEVEDYMLRIFDGIPVTNSADNGPASLREAIETANAATVPVLIDLANLGKTAATIELTSPLPEITTAVVINGAGTVLDGSAAGTNADGLRISGDGGAVSGLTVRAFDGNGIVLAGDGAVVSDSRVENNGGSGIRVSGSANAILGTVSRANAGLGIDGGGDGATPNDPDDVDGVQNYPLITSVEIADSLRISGSLSSVPTSRYAIEFFAGTACEAGESGADAYALGTRVVTTDNTGQSNFAFAFPVPVSNTAAVTATATSAVAGTSELSACAFATEIELPAGELPPEASLGVSYPNPASGKTTIPFDLPSRAHVRIDVFDALGRRVTTLVDGETPAGRHEVTFDAAGLPAGLYIYRLTASSRTLVRHLIIVR